MQDLIRKKSLFSDSHKACSGISNEVADADLRCSWMFMNF